MSSWSWDSAAFLREGTGGRGRVPPVDVDALGDSGGCCVGCVLYGPHVAFLLGVLENRSLVFWRLLTLAVFA